MDVHAFFDLVLSICIASGKGESLQFALLLISTQEIRPHRGGAWSQFFGLRS